MATPTRLPIGKVRTESRERLSVLLAEKQRREKAKTLLVKAEESLRAFVELCWPLIEPGTPFLPGWHIDAICDHLQAVSNGEIQKLIINIPPRHGKSILTSVMWPAWTWLTRPETRWMFSAYAESLSIRDSVKCRHIIRSPLYQRNWSDRFTLANDQDEKRRFENDRTGYRLASSVGGTNVGEGGDFIVCVSGSTLITTDAGKLTIQRIVDEKLPVKVLGKSGAWQDIEAYEKHPGKLRYTISDDHSHTLTVTADHHVWVEQAGYVASDLIDYKYTHLHVPFIPYFLCDDGTKARMTNMDKLERGEEDVYNLRVTPDHSYYANGILVHNCDDPNDVNQVESDIVRSGVNEWWDYVMSTRGNTRRSAFVIIQQRCHAEDLSGHVLEQGGYEHLCLPARWEG